MRSGMGVGAVWDHGVMLEQKRNYPVALAAGPEHGEAGVRDAVRWVTAKLAEVGGQPLVFVPGKSNLEGNTLLRAFAGRTGVAVATWRGSIMGWSGGPVLAAWPSREKLGEIADDRRTTALCVVPWGPGDVDPWTLATDPELLGPATPRPVDPAALDPVVIAGLESLTSMVNHANNLAGSMDRRDAVAVLRALRSAGYRWNPDHVYAWALAHGWPAGGAERLRELASNFEKGKNPQMKGANPLRPDIVEIWRTTAGTT